MLFKTINLKIQASYIAVLLFFLTSFQLIGQEKTISGLVTDDKGMPLPAASVTVKGQKTGTYTDFDGNYSITATNKDVLIFNFLGYKKKEIAVGDKTKINAILLADVSVLDEVVVIGYGSVRRRDLTSSVSTVKSESIDKIKTTSFEGALANRAAGVQVVTSEGGPDASFKIRVRGGTSINASNDPLYVVDGFPINGGGVSTSSGLGNSSTSPLASLDPASIESIDVLKDASATAIYGSRGANGVVIITTKQGKSGRMNLTFDTFTSVSVLSNRLDVLTPEEYIQYANDFQPWDASLTSQKKFLAERYRVDDGTGTFVPVDVNNPNLFIDDWQDNITRPAITNNYVISANGGNDKTRYAANLSYINREGIIKTTDFERYNINLNINQKLNKRLRTGFNANLGYVLRSGVVTSATGNGSGRAGVVTSAALFSPVLPIRHSDNAEIEESLGIEFDEEGRMIANQNGDINNPTLMLEENKNIGTNFQGRFNAFLEYKILDGLTFKSSVRGYASRNKTKAYFSERFGWARAIGGSATTRFMANSSIVTEQNLNFTKKFGKHRINATLVAERQQNTFESLVATSTGFEIPNLNLDALQFALNTSPTQSNSIKTSLESYLARMQYNFSWKYFLTASVRYDGSSRFAEGNKWGVFPAIGAAWTISNEKFLKNNKIISNAKLRVSYGETGNNQIGAYQSLAGAGLAGYIFDGSTLNSGATITRLPNEDLTWETTIQSDIGLSLGLFDGRVNIEADYYNKDTNDLLLQVPLPVTSGFRTAFQNIGSVNNRGFEFAVNAVVVENDNFKWDTNFNISFNKNEVTNLGNANEFFVTAIGDFQIQNDYVVRVGESLGSIFGLQDDGVYTFSDFVEFDGLTDAEAADLLYANANGVDNWYSVNIYTLKPGVVQNSTVAPGTYRPGMTKFKDHNGDGIINDEDRHIIGNTQPIHFGGFTNNFSYKNFDLSIQTAWSYGNDIYNKGIKKMTNTANPWGNKIAIVNDRWSPENPNNQITSFNTGASGDINSAAYSRFIEDGSFLRVSNITLGYQFPKKNAKSLGVNSIRLYGAVDNAFLWTNYSGWDPDVSVGNNQLTPGLDIDSYPRERTFRLGVNVKF